MVLAILCCGQSTSPALPHSPPLRPPVPGKRCGSSCTARSAWFGRDGTQAPARPTACCSRRCTHGRSTSRTGRWSSRATKLRGFISPFFFPFSFLFLSFFFPLSLSLSLSVAVSVSLYLSLSFFFWPFLVQFACVSRARAAHTHARLVPCSSQRPYVSRVGWCVPPRCGRGASSGRSQCPTATLRCCR